MTKEPTMTKFNGKIKKKCSVCGLETYNLKQRYCLECKSDFYKKSQWSE